MSLKNFRRTSFFDGTTWACLLLGRKATNEAATQLGLKTMGSEAGNAKALVPIIKQWFGSNLSDKPLLFPCADIRKDILPEALKTAGIPLQELIAYCTSPHSDLQENVQSYLRSEGDPQCIVFYSPSSVQYSIQFLQSHMKDWQSVKLISIGPSTSDAMETTGCSVTATASRPSPEGILEAIRSCTQTEMCLGSS
ncbi:uroporphyrinogen-III synthase-like [Corticium candelabrum]|uniref:uroporphyrinogen-III synthase-like n=1 Tax=Corticium candelabrum TaxID=121492 RepID=UPI002E254080|nr:uroporphyrinogen-III synthase-like [Corticium candelabrum]